MVDFVDLDLPSHMVWFLKFSVDSSLIKVRPSSRSFTESEIIGAASERRISQHQIRMTDLDIRPKVLRKDRMEHAFGKTLQGPDHFDHSVPDSLREDSRFSQKEIEVVTSYFPSGSCNGPFTRISTRRLHSAKHNLRLCSCKTCNPIPG